MSEKTIRRYMVTASRGVGGGVWRAVSIDGALSQALAFFVDTAKLPDLKVGQVLSFDIRLVESEAQ